MRLLVLLVLLIVVVALVARWSVRQREGQPQWVFQTRREPGNRLDVLKWLAVLPLVPAAPLLFFGLTWFAPGLMAAGLGFVCGAVVIWRVFSHAWPVARLH